MHNQRKITDFRRYKRRTTASRDLMQRNRQTNGEFDLRGVNNVKRRKK